MPPNIFARHSSEVDWCEANYLHSEYVAEYYNTQTGCSRCKGSYTFQRNFLQSFMNKTVVWTDLSIPLSDKSGLCSGFGVRSLSSVVSNISFLFVGPLMMYLLHPYACRRSLMVHGVWILFTVIGLFSIYYHMTLSFFGQLLDEISILWVICLGYSLWFPKSHFPRFITSRGQFGVVVLITAVVSTLMSFVKPTINAYVLNSITFHILYILVNEIRKCSDKDIINLAFTSFCLWLLAISCWLSDRFFCNFWKRIDFCYLHSFWHIFICVTVCHINTVFAYFDAQYEIPECTVQVQYWPLKSTRFGLPYLAITTRKDVKKHC